MISYAAAACGWGGSFILLINNTLMIIRITVMSNEAVNEPPGPLTISMIKTSSTEACPHN